MPEGPILLPFQGVWPCIAEDAFVAPGAVVVGDVEIGAGASIWFNVTIRGDVAPIRIGARTNVQDGSILHVDPDAPCIVDEEVTIGHGAIVHGTTVERGATIGMGAIILSRSRIGAGAVVAAGALVAEDALVPAGALVMGVPAKERGALDPARLAGLRAIPGRYVALGATYRQTLTNLAAIAAGERGRRGDDGG